jgi:hypothetical protein
MSQQLSLALSPAPVSVPEAVAALETLPPCEIVRQMELAGDSSALQVRRTGLLWAFPSMSAVTDKTVRPSFLLALISDVLCTGGCCVLAGRRVPGAGEHGGKE